MGLFFSSPEEKYSKVRHPVMEIELRKLVSRSGGSLTQQDESTIETALLHKKHEHEDKLSLRDVYLVLHTLKNKQEISIFDEKKVMKEFEDFFASHH
ncbi:MAG: hypothetical protein A2821_01680 [Candidatus Magasanikbacteria bacterium RIFCSPHIGHO2_01_FULL_41_23]|uniref:Uncharacterized protein n=1 Tax=Candidatus Magasanikbacteria bacterium RIFCSPLOWO2_01_FULL_40_15 TaxID=1798686 RepID=A0A1F6N229_9BACT|nr:MAG: hypothetical protein A2821_01680 [Candidatus Magasanikbacteria bacterium RIFCSPHIGHO2_01_FULL_41_23]OGH66829.1 MAG: hypothetical protein A3C66_01985 [Candidatus Magasanikbacteria bacterium RIFCSPHIGHO2_02_FULL_41_35]OGH76652.1 MAG: hypothetical protein A3F22_00940 [Candidatus Magasanikbacteria bacterium RIFCSPHIGHO2_12_FULL_41_16]OGH77989.1 MAG: hypothetical protein A2983_02385 [Candidatus Magasanikbacteria bacterium RIFCSPLOWO2_01_FULL_40_15]